MKHFRNMLEARRRTFSQRGQRFRQNRPHGASLRLEALEDRRLLAGDLVTSLTGEITSAVDPTVMTLQVNGGVLGAGSAIVGIQIRPTGNAGTALDPAAPEIRAGNTALIPILSQNNLPDGSSLSIVSLPLNQLTEFTLLLRGEGAQPTGTFQIDIFVPGDIDGDGGVSEFEKLYASATLVQGNGGGNQIVTPLFYRHFGIDLGTSLAKPEQDVNRDGKVDASDMKIIEASGSTAVQSAVLVGDQAAPVIQVALDQDTGRADVAASFTDGITSDVTGAVVVGTLTDASDIAFFRASIDSTTNFINVPFSAAGGPFSFTLAQLESLAGGASLVNNGQHTLRLIAGDVRGNQLGPDGGAPVVLNFTLDTIVPPAPTAIALNASSDSGTPGDGITNDNTPTLNADAESGALVQWSSNLVTSGPIASGVAGSPVSATSSQLPDGVHTITAKATDIAGNQSTASAAIIVTIDTVAPATPTLGVIGGGGDQTPDTPADLVGTTSAEAGLAVSLTNNRSAAVLQTTTNAAGQFTFASVDLAHGQTNFTVTVTDVAGNSSSFTQTITQNAQPFVETPIADVVTDEDALFTLDVSSNFDDDDLGRGDGLTFSVTLAGGGVLPSWLSINSTTGVLSGTPLNDHVGIINVRVTATDLLGASISDTFQLQVLNTNDSPIINNRILSVPPDSVVGTVVGNVNATDPDVGDVLTYEIIAGDADAVFAIDGTGQITVAKDEFLPEGADPFVLTVRVTDSADPALSAEAQITINVVSNNVPTVANPIPDQNATEDSGFAFQVASNTFQDVEDGTDLSYTATLADDSPLPAWLGFSPTFFVFSGVPGNADVGVIQVKVTAEDSGGLTVSDIFQITVQNTNDVPVVSTPIPNTTTAEDAPFNLDVSGNFSDDDLIHGDSVTFSATLAGGGALPSWLSFNAATGVFSGTPNNSRVGTISITVTATDESAASVSDTFNLTVTNTNDPPTVNAPIPNQVASFSTQFNFTFAANAFADVDVGDVLTYTATRDNDSALPAWLSFNASTRTFSGTPSEADEGEVSVKVTATDLAGASVSDVFTITVSAGPSLLVELVVRAAATASSEFTFFTANPGAGATGVGRFQLVAGASESLSYSLGALDEFDLDGNQTVDINDNVTAIHFHDASNGDAIAFTIFDVIGPDDDDLVIDAAAGTVTGIWETAEGFNAFRSKLYAGQLYVNVHTVANPGGIKVANRNITPSAELVVLPESLESVLVDGNYVVEVWVSDVLASSTGLTSVLADLHFNQTLGSGVTVSNSGPFDFAASGSISNSTGVVSSLGGGTVFAGVGLEPAFARVGFVEFSASAQGTQEFSLGFIPDAVFRQGPDPALTESEIQFGTATLEHVGTTQFAVTGLSNVTWSGSFSATFPMFPQFAGANTTTAGGTIDVVIDDLDNPQFITFVDAAIDLNANTSGTIFPGQENRNDEDPADFGLEIPDFFMNIAIRDVLIDIFSDGPISIVNEEFLASAQSWRVDASFDEADSALDTYLNHNSIDGLLATNNGSPASSLREISAGLFELRLPFTRTMTLSFYGNGQSTITGEIVAQFSTGAIGATRGVSAIAGPTMPQAYQAESGGESSIAYAGLLMADGESLPAADSSVPNWADEELYNNGLAIVLPESQGSAESDPTGVFAALDPAPSDEPAAQDDYDWSVAVEDVDFGPIEVVFSQWEASLV